MNDTANLSAPAPQGLPYRDCVGIMLINAEGLVWTGRRLPKWANDDSAFVWQMPQGGIGKGEDFVGAARRELFEETNVTSADVIAVHPNWLTYELPSELLGVGLKGKYCGQRQRWVAMRFWGDDSEIDIGPRRGHKAEFDRWRWRPIIELPGLIVPFKRQIYEAVCKAFAPYAKAQFEALVRI